METRDLDAEGKGGASVDAIVVAAAVARRALKERLPRRERVPAETADAIILV